MLRRAREPAKTARKKLVADGFVTTGCVTVTGGD